MNIKMIICDLDGSLINPSSGLYVSDEVANKIIQLEEKGIIVVLNSARCLQGIEPLAKQLQLDKYKGYVISCNGVNIKDFKTNTIIYEHFIKHEECLEIWNKCIKYHVSPAFLQKDCMVAHYMTKGYELDSHNCDIDYMCTNNPEVYLKDAVWKMSISQTKEQLDQCFFNIKQELESNYPVTVVRSTDDFVDIIPKGVNKYNASQYLLDICQMNWQDVSTIGDGYADLDCIIASKLGVSLENGKTEVKEAANMVVRSCYENGCIEWLDYLLNDL